MASRLSDNRLGGDYTGTRSFDNNDFTNCSLAAVAVMTRYSASVEERATMHCFIELQEIGLAPRKIRKTYVEVQSFGLPADRRFCVM